MYSATSHSAKLSPLCTFFGLSYQNIAKGEDDRETEVTHFHRLIDDSWRSDQKYALIPYPGEPEVYQ